MNKTAAYQSEWTEGTWKLHFCLNFQAHLQEISAVLDTLAVLLASSHNASRYTHIVARHADAADQIRSGIESLLPQPAGQADPEDLLAACMQVVQLKNTTLVYLAGIKREIPTNAEFYQQLEVLPQQLRATEITCRPLHFQPKVALA